MPPQIRKKFYRSTTIPITFNLKLGPVKEEQDIVALELSKEILKTQSAQSTVIFAFEGNGNWKLMRVLFFLL